MPDGDVAHHTLAPEKPRQSRAPKPERPAKTIPLNAAGFSIETLGRQLVLASRRQHLLDCLGRDIGREEIGPNSQMTPARLRQRHVDRAEKATDDHYFALVDLILCSRPVTIGDVVTQLLAADLHIHRVRAGDDAEKNETAHKILSRVLSNAARCLAENCGLKLADLGEALTWSDQWPDVDLSGVVGSDFGGCNHALDGSVPEWDR